MASRTLRVEIIGDASSLQHALGQATHSTDAFGGLLRKSGLLAVGGLAVAAGAVTKVGFSFDSMKQQAQVAFTTLLGSGKKAQVFLNKLFTLAAHTPFQFKGITQAAQRLLAMGFNAKEVIPSLNAIGDATSALGASQETMDRITMALGQMRNSAHLSAQDMNQLTQAGINGWGYLAKAAGVSIATIRERSAKGMIDSRQAVKTILAGMEDDFKGSMEKQSHTFAGLWSTLQDTFSQVAGTVMMPFFEMATNGMQALADATSGPGFQNAMKKFSLFMGEAGDAVGRFIDLVKKNWPEIEATIVPVMKSVGDVIAAVVADATAIWNRWGNDIQAVVRAWVTVLRDQLRIVSDVFRVFADLLRGNWSKLWQDLKKTVADTFGLILAEVRLVAQELLLAMKALGGLALDGLRAGLTGLAGVIGNALSAGITRIRSFFDDARSAAAGLGRSILSGLESALSALGSLLVRMVKAPVNALIDQFNALGIPSFHVHIGIPGPVPDVDFSTPSIGLPDIPHLAKGGLITQSGIAVVHRGETVVPPGKQSMTVIVNAPNYVGDKRELMSVIRNEFTRMQRNGTKLGFN